MDSSLPGSSVHGIFQERVLEWVAISFSKQTKPKQNPKLVKKKKKWYNKDQSRNTWKRNEGHNSKYQQNCKLVLEKISKIGKPLARLIKNKTKKEKTQTNETRNEKGEATTDEAELHGLKGDCHKQLVIISVGSEL